MPDPRGVGDVVEGAVPFVVEETMARARRYRWRIERPAVDEEEIDPAVAVVIEEQRPGPHRLDQVLLGARAVGVTERQPRNGGDVLEGDGRHGRRAGLCART